MDFEFLFSNIFFWIALIIVFLAATTWLLKKLFGVQTFLIASMFKTSKNLDLLDKFALKIGPKWLDRITELGLILGFGVLAADYLYGRGKPLKQRLIPSILAVILLTVLFYGLEFIFGMENPFIKAWSPVLYFSFILFGLAGFTMMSLLGYGIFILSNVLIGEKVCPGIAPVLPGIKIPNVPITIPWHAWISLLIILIIHEGMHGIVARREGLKIKSWGLLLAGIFPIGAFVEPDEDELKKTEPHKALRVFSAGPTSNFLSMIAILAIFNLLFVAIFFTFGGWASNIQKNSVESVYIASVDQNIMLCGKKYESPSLGKLSEGMTILKANGKNVSKASILAVEIANSKNKQLELTVKDKNGIVSNQTINPTEFGVYGFKVSEKKKEGFSVPLTYKIYGFAINSINAFVLWLVVLSLLMAMSNFLPTEPFDGGKIAKILLIPYFGFLNLPKEDLEKKIGKTLSAIILIILLVNALPLFL